MLLIVNIYISLVTTELLSLITNLNIYIKQYRQNIYMINIVENTTTP